MEIFAFLFSLASSIVFLAFWIIGFIVLIVIGFLVGGTPVYLKNYDSGLSKVVRPGFSFTYLFFGFFTPLIRGHIGAFLLALAIDFFTIFMGRVIFAFFINKLYIDYLCNNGYVVIDESRLINGEPPVREY